MQSSEQEEAAKEDKEFAHITDIQEQMYKKIGGMLPLGDVPRPDMYPTDSHDVKSDLPATDSHIERKPSYDEESYEHGYKKDNLPNNSTNTNETVLGSNSTTPLSTEPSNNTLQQIAPKEESSKAHDITIEVGKSKSMNFDGKNNTGLKLSTNDAADAKNGTAAKNNTEAGNIVHKRDVKGDANGEPKKSKRKYAKTEKLKQARGGKKNAVIVNRPPVIYHPPPEIYHRPAIVLHRPPILIERPSIVYHQPPVIVHRPAVIYRQPPLIFHQPPPVVHQPLLRSHDSWMPIPSLHHVGSEIQRAGVWSGVPKQLGWDSDGVTNANGINFGHGDFHEGETELQGGNNGMMAGGVNGGLAVESGGVGAEGGGVSAEGGAVGAEGAEGGNMGMGMGVDGGSMGVQDGAVGQIGGQEVQGLSVANAGEGSIDNGIRKSDIHKRKDRKKSKQKKKSTLSRLRRSASGGKTRTKDKKGTKKDVVVNRPPIIYHPPPEIYHRPDIVIHRPPIVIHRPPIIYHQPPVIVHRPAVVYHQPPIIFHQPPPAVQQPLLYSHDTFVVHPSFVAQHLGSILRTAHHYIGPPRLLTHMGQPLFQGLAGQLEEESHRSNSHDFGEGGFHSAEMNGGNMNEALMAQNGIHGLGFDHSALPDLRSLHDFASNEQFAMNEPAFQPSQTRTMDMERPGVSGFPDFSQSPSAMEPEQGQQGMEGSMENQSLEPLAYPNDVPSGMEGMGRFKRSKISKGKHKKHHKEETGSKRQYLFDHAHGHSTFEFHHSHDGGREVVLHRPGVVFHPPPEVVHRPNIVIHRAPLLVQRPPIIVHQPPVVIHRPPIFYHQPDVVFHTPPPMVHHQKFYSHDMYAPVPRFSHVHSHVTKVHDLIGNPFHIHGYSHGYDGHHIFDNLREGHFGGGDFYGGYMPHADYGTSHEFIGHHHRPMYRGELYSEHGFGDVYGTRHYGHIMGERLEGGEGDRKNDEDEDEDKGKDDKDDKEENDEDDDDDSGKSRSRIEEREEEEDRDDEEEDEGRTDERGESRSKILHVVQRATPDENSGKQKYY